MILWALVCSLSIGLIVLTLFHIYICLHYILSTLSCYSETGCSFARHLAILSRNVGILIGSLLRASCDSNFNLLFKYCELTVMASNITSVSKREKVISFWSSGYRNKEIT